MENQKIRFITGVSTGFGLCFAQEVLKKGDIVIGTVRKQNQVEEFTKLHPNNAYAYLLDITDEKRVLEVAQEVIQKFGKIDVLVNNAGYGIVGAIEETSMQEVRDQMETNFFGALQVTKAFLPMFRQQKSGFILQISSMAGIVSAPGLGAYNASKYALEGFSESLAIELKPLGIKVLIVEPGPFRTKWASASLKVAQEHIEDYDKTAGFIKAFKGNENQPGDPIRGVQAVIKVMESEDMPVRLALGEMAVKAIDKKLKIIKKDLDNWRDVSLDTNYLD